MAEMPRMLIDTDIGVDDALAILMVLAAHRQELVKVVAITTTHGNSKLHHVNNNIFRLLDTVDMLHVSFLLQCLLSSCIISLFYFYIVSDCNEVIESILYCCFDNLFHQ